MDDRSRLTEALKASFARTLAPPAAAGRDVPMSFSDALLGAILAGRKTETRRPIRPQPTGASVDATPDVAAGDRLAIREPWCRSPAGGYAYRRDGPLPPGVARWTPARFMPRDAARLFLTVKSVESARLHSIDEAAANAEGFAASPLGNLSARDAFLATWDTFYGATEYAASRDPSVWIIRFARPV